MGYTEATANAAVQVQKCIKKWLQMQVQKTKTQQKSLVGWMKRIEINTNYQINASYVLFFNVTVF